MSFGFRWFLAFLLSIPVSNGLSCVFSEDLAGVAFCVIYVLVACLAAGVLKIMSKESDDFDTKWTIFLAILLFCFVMFCR